MRKLLLLPILLFSLVSLGQNNIWTRADDNFASSEKKYRANIPAKYQTFALDMDALKAILATAPLRNSSRNSNTIISLPDANGNFQNFLVFEAPIMEAGLAAKFPMIKSYPAQGVDDKSAVARFSVTTLGFHSMTLSRGSSTTFIDPLTIDQRFYMVYEKSSLENPLDFVCESGDGTVLPSIDNDRNSSLDRADADDGLLRTYRLAQSCTAEYGNIFAGNGTLMQKKANIQSQMAITMTRVNGVYELDLGITMIFVANNDLLIYLGDVNADPWTGEYNTKTAQTIDAQIGVNNYDIGHNFNTTGGGNAGCIACVCKSNSQNSTHKGRGYTGRSNPTGDPFDIDYVAHEMGHQFGGYHTMSSSSCRSGSGLTEVEPGSASTIMGYAGNALPMSRTTAMLILRT